MRTLKPIGPDLRDGFLGATSVAQMTGAPSHIRQFGIVTFAQTKAIAVEQLKVLGGGFQAANIRVQIGDAVRAFQDSELSFDDGAVYVWHQSLDGNPIVRVAVGEELRVVGYWRRGADGHILGIVPIGQSDLSLADKLTIDDVVEFLSEGFHTAFRKAVPDSETADKIWHLISAMDDDEWNCVLNFVASPLIDFIRERGLA